MHHVGTVRVITRADAGLRAAKSSSRLTLPVPQSWIHHTASDADLDHVPREPKLREQWFLRSIKSYWREVQAFHMDTNDWSDIGYNFGLAPGILGLRPRVLEGRGYNVGAHTQGSNSTSIGIVLIGNYQTKKLNPLARRKLRRLFDELVRIGILEGPRRRHPTGGHRDAPGASTACPGKNITAQMLIDELTKEVK